MTLSAVLCLALNIYGEARGESVEGQLAVAQVTMNRVSHPDYPDDVCAVVFQEKQFSWTNMPIRLDEPEALVTAILVAEEVLTNRPEDLTDGATHFYSGTRKPSWAGEMLLVGRIEGHTFFKENTP